MYCTDGDHVTYILVATDFDQTENCQNTVLGIEADALGIIGLAKRRVGDICLYFVTGSFKPLKQPHVSVRSAAEALQILFKAFRPVLQFSMHFLRALLCKKGKGATRGFIALTTRKEKYPRIYWFRQFRFNFYCASVFIFGVSVQNKISTKLIKICAHLITKLVLEFLLKLNFEVSAFPKRDAETELCV